MKTTGLPQWVTLPAIFLLTAVIMAGIGKITADLFRQLPSLDAYRDDLLGSITGSVSFAVLSWLRAPSVVWGVLAAAALLILGGRRSTVLYGIPLSAMVAALLLETTTAGISWSPYYKIQLKPSPTATRTENPYILVSNRSATDYRRPPITEAHLHRLLQRLGGVHATQLRIDRVLDEPTSPPTRCGSCGCSAFPPRPR